MPDSLLFDGTDDRIRFTLGGGGFAPPACFAAIAKAAADGSDRSLLGFTSLSVLLHRMTSGNLVSLTRPGVADSGSALALTVADDWCLIAAQKATGTVAPVLRRFKYSTGTWTHITGGTSFDNWGAPSGQIAVGDIGNGSELWSGNILICGFWDRTFTNAEFEALSLEDTLQAWVDAAPVEAFRLNTLSTISSLTGTSVEASRTGTTLDTDDVPAGWIDGEEEDTEPPTDPTGLTATPVSSARIDLDWANSTDNIGVTGYRVERCTGAACVDFAEIATAPTSAYINTGLTPETLYRYRVRAEDAAANLSGYSSVAEATTEAVPTTFGLGDLMDEMAATLLAVVGPAVDETEFQVVGRMNPNPTPPSIDIYPGDPFRDNGTAGFGDAGGELLFTVRARVTTVDNIAGQNLLLRLMDDEDDISVAGTLMEDQTLNGLASSVYVEGNTGYTRYMDGGTESGGLLGCEWRVRVLRVTS